MSIQVTSQGEDEKKVSAFIQLVSNFPETQNTEQQLNKETSPFT